MKPPRLPMLIPIAAVLIGLALWVHLGAPDEDYAPPAMTAAELAALQPGPESDLRLLTELRRQIGYEPGAWRDLSPAGQTVFLTLWAEEQHRTITWPQAAMAEAGEGQPALAEVARAYDTLALPNLASAVRSLASEVAAGRAAFAAWRVARESGKGLQPPDGHGIETAARAAFSGLDQVRVRRLELVRGSVAEFDHGGE